jgi:hypothetical protein
MTLKLNNHPSSIPSLVLVCDLCGDVTEYDTLITQLSKKNLNTVWTWMDIDDPALPLPQVAP